MLVKTHYTILTSESVNIGHPDKTCDYIADSFLDEALKQDPNSQMAVECAIKDDKLFIYGEATTTATINYEAIARKALKEIGYECKFKIIKEISEQSPDINQAVVKSKLCANDQGMVYGYATTETKEFMPMPILIAHKLMKAYDKARKTTLKGYYADAKSQVTIKYLKNKPISIETVLVSVSHSIEKRIEEIKREMVELIKTCLDEYKGIVDITNTKIIVNPSGKFTIWGSFSDSGCVGRKIVVDTYGGIGRVGGGCFSSKNATKVDRSGAYYARYVAKNIVANGLADNCEVQVAYGIGMEQPIAVNVECFGTNNVPLSTIEEFVNKNFDFSPANIIKELDLLKPIYKKTSCYGHFGREEFSWEKVKNYKVRRIK